ncbi:methyl-accepting chemotaxis protein [Tepidibacter aestuarii]|uniref:methyl-accepting chemotaxis protein n=1 Tax=Tepidibacter aestuarii TaxID=2925782 RepID=UPI0020BEA127|nr:methyl-accepting chemotaxis protein [Tepidibacter aestuarii]CAH2214931.1 methyl-accepting chemotaxis protein [Tepidibacter aestuarii]
MILKFRDWKIRKKLLGGFLGLILLFILFGVTVYMSIYEISNQKIPLMRNVDDIYNITLELRKNEKDFFIRDSTNLEFFKTGKSEHIDKFESNFNKLIDTINLIKKNKMILSNEDDIKKLNQMIVLSQEYHDKFLKVVEKTKTKGFKDYGLIGELRKAANTIENSVEILPRNKDLKILLLQARRNEKDYLLRKDVQYPAKLDETVYQFKTLLNSTKYNQETKLDINTLIEEYKNSFDKVVSIDKEIGFKETQGLIGAYRKTIHSLEPLVDAVHKNIMTEIDQEAQNKIRKTIISIILINVFAVLSAIYISKLITKPIKKMVDKTQIIASGDLTQEIKVYSKDEIGDFTASLKTMQESLRNLIGNLYNSADNVSSSSQQLAMVSEENAQMSEQVAQTMKQLAIGVGNQSDHTTKTNKLIVNLMDHINLVNENSYKMAQLSNDVSIQANLGKEVMDTATNQMDKINTTTCSANEVIQELNEKSKKIGQILEVISNISEQTNLLALNAAIESARAGEQGRGFAVLAEEIRKLAAQSQNSSKEIYTLIADLQNGISVVVSSIENTSVEVDLGKKIINQTGYTFEKILKTIKETTEKIKEVSSGIEEIRYNGEQAAQSVEEIASITNEFESSIEEVSVSAQQQSASVEEIAATSNELAQMAEYLNSLVGNFKI